MSKSRITDQQYAELEAKYGEDLARVQSDALDKEGFPRFEVVLRKPSGPEYKQYRAQVHNDQRAPEALEILVRRIMVVPSGDGIEALFEKWPGIAEKCRNATYALLGITGGEYPKS